jgi:hypothetical protein
MVASAVSSIADRSSLAFTVIPLMSRGPFVGDPIVSLSEARLPDLFPAR